MRSNKSSSYFDDTENRSENVYIKSVIAHERDIQKHRNMASNLEKELDKQSQIHEFVKNTLDDNEYERK